MSIINDRIYQAIKKSGMSYGELAQKTGISKSALQRYATEDAENIRTGRLLAIAEATGVDPGWLANWFDPYEEEPADGKIKLTPEEEKLLHYYRGAEDKYKEFALEILIDHQTLGEFDFATQVFDKGR